MIALKKSELISPKCPFSHTQLEQFMKKMLTYEVHARQFSLDILEEAFHLLSITPKTTTFTKIEQMRLHEILDYQISKIQQTKRISAFQEKYVQEIHILKNKINSLQDKIDEKQMKIQQNRNLIESLRDQIRKNKSLQGTFKELRDDLLISQYNQQLLKQQLKYQGSKITHIEQYNKQPQRDALTFVRNIPNGLSIIAGVVSAVTISLKDFLIATLVMYGVQFILIGVIEIGVIECILKSECCNLIKKYHNYQNAYEGNHEENFQNRFKKKKRIELIQFDFDQDFQRNQNIQIDNDIDKQQNR